jgi:hypothetical protein
LKGQAGRTQKETKPSVRSIDLKASSLYRLAGASGKDEPLIRTRGQSTGKRSHKPFTITKQYDKSTPMMAKSATPQKLKIRGVVTRRDADTFAVRAETKKPKVDPVKLQGVDGESMDKDHKGRRVTSPGLLDTGGGFTGQAPAAAGSSTGGGGSRPGGPGTIRLQ